jgi:hypothetical protein
MTRPAASLATEQMFQPLGYDARPVLGNKIKIATILRAFSWSILSISL